MNKVNFILLSLIATLMMIACSQAPKEKTLAAELAEIRAKQIDFFKNATPKAFSATAMDGSTINSKDYKGKYWVLFAYNNSYLTKIESYDMVAELKNTHQLYGEKIPMVAIIDGFCDNDAQLKKQVDSANFSFPQIDNTQAPNKNKKVEHNIFCTPAKIIIDPNGKVIYNGCGGNTETFDLMLKALVKTEKL